MSRGTHLSIFHRSLTIAYLVIWCYIIYDLTEGKCQGSIWSWYTFWSLQINRVLLIRIIEQADKFEDSP